MNKRILYVALLAVLALSGAGIARADDDDDDDRGRRGIPVREANGAPLEFRLIQVNAFNPAVGIDGAGNDQLVQDANNHLAVLNNRTVQIEFHPVPVQPPATVSYRVWFCRFGAVAAPSSAGTLCVPLLNPASTATPKEPLSLTADASGTAKGTGVFPPLAADAPAGSDVWSGTFVVTRDITVNTATTAVAQFVSAFEFRPGQDDDGPPPQQVTGAEIELKGEVSAINDAEGTFQLAGVSAFKVKIDDSTRFIGRYKSLDRLHDGLTVEVRGYLQTDAANVPFVLAERIKAGNGGGDDDDD